MRRCSRCREVKPLTEFVRNRSAKGGFGYYCLPCHNIVTKRNTDRRYGSRKSFLLKLRYGIDEADFDRIVEAQGGLCAVCRRCPAKHVDHDHETCKIRGILCFTCNRALGYWGDEPANLELASFTWTPAPRTGRLGERSERT